MHAQVAATAFRQLPQRWRCVLWYTEVERRAPAEVAELLDLTPNGVAALAYRAREALRQAYLDQYLPSAPSRECRPVVEQLAKWVRHRSPATSTKRIRAHINKCGGCRGLAADLEQLNQQLPLLLGPLVAGAPLAIASLAGTAGSLVAATGVAETGLSIASWATAAKTALAGAAVVATTSLGAADSAPAAPPQEHHVVASQSPSPSTHHDQHAASAEIHGPKPGKQNEQSTKTHKEKKQAGKTSGKKDKKAKAKKPKKETGTAKQKKKAKK